MRRKVRYSNIANREIERERERERERVWNWLTLIVVPSVLVIPVIVYLSH